MDEHPHDTPSPHLERRDSAQVVVEGEPHFERRAHPTVNGAHHVTQELVDTLGPMVTNQDLVEPPLPMSSPPVTPQPPSESGNNSHIWEVMFKAFTALTERVDKLSQDVQTNKGDFVRELLEGFRANDRDPMDIDRPPSSPKLDSDREREGIISDREKQGSDREQEGIISDREKHREVPTSSKESGEARAFPVSSRDSGEIMEGKKKKKIWGPKEKIEFDRFDGSASPSKLLDWVRHLQLYFKEYPRDEDEKLALATISLEKDALLWWTDRQLREPSIRTFEEFVSQLKATFLPINYEEDLGLKWDLLRH